MSAGARSRADFEEYAAARRPDLVRLLALMGLPSAHAAVVADRALLRAAREWGDLSADAAPDARLLDLALDEHARDRTPWWDTVGPALSLGEPLSGSLDRLRVGDRARSIWSVLGREATTTQGREDDPALQAGILAVASGIVVPPPSGATPERDRRPGLRLVAAVVALLLVASGVSFVLRPGEGDSMHEPLGPVTVAERANPAPVAWYADGRLHLTRVVVALDGVRAVVEMDDGAVYVDDRGRVVRLEEDGDRTELGRTDPEAGLVGSSLFGRAAWVTVDGEGIEVADVASGEVVARRDFDARPDGAAQVPGRLLRMAGAILRYTESGREYTWDTAGQTFQSDVQGASRGLLVDAVGTTEVRQVADDTIVVSQRYGRTRTFTGVGAEISPRQQFVLTRTGEGGTGVRVVSVASGEEITSGTTEADIVLDARFSEPDRITYLLADRAAIPGASEAGRLSSTGPLEVRTCQVRTGVCVVHASGAGAADTTALLGR